MIIAVKEKDSVVIAYTNVDSWNGYYADEDYVDEENLPIKFSESGRLYALAELNRVSDVLLSDEGFINSECTPKTIVRSYIPFIKDVSKDNFSTIEDGYWGNALVICDNETIYDIDPQFVFCQVKDFVCHGIGVEVIRCVLDSTVGLSAKERILKAINFACKHNKINLYPIVMTDTKSKKLQVIYEGENNRERIDSI